MVELVGVIGRRSRRLLYVLANEAFDALQIEFDRPHEMCIDRQTSADDPGERAMDHATGGGIDAVAARLDAAVRHAAVEPLDLRQRHREVDIPRRIRPKPQPPVIEAEEGEVPSAITARHRLQRNAWKQRTRNAPSGGRDGPKRRRTWREWAI